MQGRAALTVAGPTLLPDTSAHTLFWFLPRCPNMLRTASKPVPA